MRKAFTLIELLIVIAIIAILALIAIPNFLEAQVRSKVARVQADMRSIATAIESYTVDYNRCPIGYGEERFDPKIDWGLPPENFERLLAKSYSQMTTPIAYLTSVPRDPFIERSGQIGTGGVGNPNGPEDYQSVTNPDAYAVAWSPNEHRAMRRMGYAWYIQSCGPSRSKAAQQTPPGLARLAPNWPDTFYDPSNGTMSTGNIVRSNKGQP